MGARGIGETSPGRKTLLARIDIDPAGITSGNGKIRARGRRNPKRQLERIKKSYQTRGIDTPEKVGRAWTFLRDSCSLRI
jgi:hypothetical protein